MKPVDHQAQVLLKNDAKFLAKLTGLGTPFTRKSGAHSRPNSPGQPLSAGTKKSGTVPATRLVPGNTKPTTASGYPAVAAAHNFDGSKQLADSHCPSSAFGISSPRLQQSVVASSPRLRATTAPDRHQAPAADNDNHACDGRCSNIHPEQGAADGTLQQSPCTVEWPHAATAAAGAIGPTEHCNPAAAGQQQQQQHEPQQQDANTRQDQQQHMQQQQQQPQRGVQSSKAARESPPWLVKSTTAGFKVRPGPLQIESSLYAAWAHTTPAPGADPAAASPAAVVSPQCGRRSLSPPPTRSVPATAADVFCSAGCRSASGARCTSPAASESVASAATATAAAASPGLQTAAASAAAACTGAGAGALPGTPCSSNYHSSWAASLAAGISRAGATRSPEHQDWSKQQLKPHPPRREDVEQLKWWLVQELQQLHEQVQQGQQLSQQLPAGSTSQQKGTYSKCQLEQQQLQQRQQSPSQKSRPPISQLPNGGVFESSISGTFSSKAPERCPSPVGKTFGGLGQSRPASPPKGMPQVDLAEQAVQLLMNSRSADRTLARSLLQQQDDIYSAAFSELCRQVSVGCVERGSLMAQLWAVLKAMLTAAQGDWQAAWEREAAREAAVEAAMREQQHLRQLHEDDRVALRAISEGHAAKAEAAKRDYEKLKQQHDKLEDLLKRLSAAQQLVQRVLDLESSNQQQATTIEQLQVQLSHRLQELQESSRHVTAWQSRAEAAEQLLLEQAQQLSCSTPRPKNDLGLLCDLLEPSQQQLVEQALVAGVPAQHIHRLLLGLSAQGQQVTPWLKLAGSCVPALQAAADPGRLHQMIRQHLTECDAASLSRLLAKPDDLQLLSQAVHLGTSPDCLVSILDGSFDLPAPATPTAAVVSRALGAATSAAAAGAGGHDNHQGLEPVSSVGVGLPYLPIVGVLAAKYGHDGRDLGGPVTQTLVHAQISTADRMQELEGACKELRREVILLKCTLAEQRKHEQERVEAVLRDQKRKAARREARQLTQLEKFIQTKWGAVFMGIGNSEDVPRVLRSNVPINNKQMTKRDAEKLAREVWAFKDELAAAGGPRISLAEATATFLERRFFAIPRLITEVAYNLIYCLGQHTHDADCNLFIRVFSGDVCESVRNEQQTLVAEIMHMLQLLDVSVNHQATGWLHKADVKTALAGFFKGKKADRLAEILEALDTDESGDACHYSCLFNDDDELSQGLAAETIRGQHLREKLELLQDIEDAIRDAADDHDTTSLNPVMLQTCLQKARRTFDEVAISALVAQAFGSNWQQQPRQTHPIGAIIKAIRCGGKQQSALGIGHAAAVPVTSVAGAVSRILPVGKFKNKLTSALHVGFSGDGSGGYAMRSKSSAGISGAGARRASRTESAAAGTRPGTAAASASGPAGANAAASKPRRGTQEAVDAAVVAALSGNTNKQPRKSSDPVSSNAVAVIEDSKQPAARALTVDVLSAMEAVRQSWLKEEEQQLNSQSGGNPAAVAAASSAGAIGGSSMGQSSTAGVTTAGISLIDVGANVVELLSSVEEARSLARAYSIQAVPSLRLAEVLPLEAQHAGNAVGDGLGSSNSTAEPSHRSSMGSALSSERTSNTASTGAASSYRGSCHSEDPTARPDTHRMLNVQPSMKSILLKQESTKQAKHVQISAVERVIAFEGDGDASVAAASGPAGLLSSAYDMSAMSSAETVAAGADDASGLSARPRPSGSVSRTSSNGSMAAGLVDDGPGPAAGSRTPRLQASTSSRHLPAATGSSSSAAAALRSKAKRSKSAKRAASLPQLLLTDADDACAAESASPMGGNEQAEVCFTPQDPEQGGKRNAFLMRRLNKGKSLKHLEEVMLAVAVGDA